MRRLRMKFERQMGQAEGDPKDRQRSKPKSSPNRAEVQNHKPERENQTKPDRSKKNRNPQKTDRYR